MSDMLEEVVNLSRLFIEAQSISPNDGGLLKFIADYLGFLGFQCEFFNFENVKNLYAKIGNDEKICFAGHVDIVPPGYTWRYDPYKGVIQNDILYGRGAVDMKVAIASALVSFKRILKNQKRSLALLLTSDEEALAEYGLKKVAPILKERGEKIKCFILGEPTCLKQAGDQIKIGRRGSVTARVQFLGQQGHIAYPELADNPIPSMVRTANELINLDFEDEDEVFGSTKLQITNLDTDNQVENLIPGSGLMMFGVRFNHKQTFESIKNKITAILNQTAQPYIITWRNHGSSFLVKDELLIEKVKDCIHKAVGIVPNCDAKGATSDGRFLTEIAPVFEVGLQEDMAHKVDESVSLEDINRLNKIYDQIFSYL
jgi:succinyl-diaminopimelate desuccinylase